jgi:hypothetical protein
MKDLIPWAFRCRCPQERETTDEQYDLIIAGQDEPPHNTS